MALDYPLRAPRPAAWSGSLRLLNPTEALPDLKDAEGRAFDGNGSTPVRASGGRLYANR